jgi:hypothetical protein
MKWRREIGTTVRVKKSNFPNDSASQFYGFGVMPMRPFIACVFATAAVAASTLAFSATPKSGADNPADAKNAQPVVVELFTSEGCSSCPPADAMLMKLKDAQPVDGARIIAIEEHVDYWNHDGWTDPFSSPEWTMRQVDYVARLKTKEPYTPQLVVDGQTQLVGGQEMQAEQAIRQAASQPKTAVTLTADNASADGTQYKVHIGKLEGATDRDTAEVWVAVSETGLGSAVKAGENAGKDLHHAPVLRSLHKIGTASPKGDTAFDGATRVKFNHDWKRENLLVAVFIQEKKSMHILGAAAVGVSN